MAAFAIPFYELVHWGSEMFRSLWSRIAQKEKEGSCPSAVITKGRDEWSFHQRRIHSSEPSGRGQGKKNTWWEVYGKKFGGKRQRDQRLRGKRCEGKKTHCLQRQPLRHCVSLNRLCPELGDGWGNKQHPRRLTKASGTWPHGKEAQTDSYPGLAEVRRKEGA